MEDYELTIFFGNSTEKQLDIDLFNSRVMRKKQGKPSCHLVLLLFFWLHPTFSKSSITQFNHTAQFVLSVTLFNLYFFVFLDLNLITSPAAAQAVHITKTEAIYCYHPIVIQIMVGNHQNHHSEVLKHVLQRGGGDI